MKKLVVGVPRALFYYQYFPFIKTFFEELGAKVVVSSLTNKKILKEGMSRLTEDVCFPVKVFCGHTISLRDKCDFIFIPSIYAIEKGVYNCAKFIGLPDLMKAAVKNIPPLLEPDINFDRGEKYVYQEFKKIAQSFTPDEKKNKLAIKKANQAQKTFLDLMKEESISPKEAIDKMFFSSSKNSKDDKKFLKTIALIGHPYLLYDDYISHNFLNKLRKMGIRILFSESISKSRLRSSLLELVDSPYWTCEDEIIGSGAYFCKREDVDGIISVGSFGCGPDSLMVEIIKKHAKEKGKPFLQIILDEHSAEVGIITRIEAFVDGLLQKKQVSSSETKNKKNQFLNPKRNKRIKAIGIPNVGEKPSVWRKLTKEKLGIDLITPKITSKTVDLGIKYSPQDICFPYKVLLGNLIEALEEGADTLIMTASSNACRMGYYLQIMEKTLDDLGYEFRFLKLKNTDKNIKGGMRILREFTNNASFDKVFSFARLGIIKLRILDEIEMEVQKIRPVEIQKGAANLIYREAIESLDRAMSAGELKKTRKEISGKLEKIPKQKNKDILKIAVVGELFAVAEPFVNQEIEKELGSRGVEVERIRSAVFSEWMRLFHFNPLGEEKKKLEKFTKPYLKRDVGGHALESLGKKISLARKEYDGIIHLMPFGCLPEIIAQNIMIGTKEKIPVLTFALDEQAEKAGMITRIEAFLDVARNYRQNKKLKT